MWAERQGYEAIGWRGCKYSPDCAYRAVQRRTYRGEGWSFTTEVCDVHAAPMGDAAGVTSRDDHGRPGAFGECCYTTGCVQGGARGIVGASSIVGDPNGHHRCAGCADALGDICYGVWRALDREPGEWDVPRWKRLHARVGAAQRLTVAELLAFGHSMVSV